MNHYGNTFSKEVTMLLDHKVLTPIEELRITREIRSEDPQLRRRSRQKLASHNMLLVASVAAKYGPRPPITRDDLFAAGCAGLHRAIEKFDHSMGYKFSTYATFWIRQAINRLIEDFGRPIRVPAHVHQFISRLNRVSSQLITKDGGEPALEDLADHLGITPEKVQFLKEVQQRCSSPASLNAPAGGTDSGAESTQTRGDTVAGPEASAEDLLPQIFDEAANEAEEIHEAVARLPEDLAYIIRERYGLGGGEPKTLRQLSEVLGISQERVRQKQLTASRELYRLLVPVRGRNRSIVPVPKKPAHHETRQLSLL